MKQTKQATNATDIRLFKIAEGFIPLAGHIDEHTIITKSGDLVQTIMVPCDTPDVREMVRKAIEVATTQISEDIIYKCGIYIHTIHDKVPTGTLASEIILAKIKDFMFVSGGFYNKVYISIVIEAQDFSIKNFKTFWTQFSNQAFKASVSKAMSRHLVELNKMTNSIAEGLAKIGAEKLGIKQVDDVFFSQNTEFFNRLLNGVTQNVPLNEVDISDVLSFSNAILSNNIIELEHGKMHSHIAVFTLKESMYTSRDTVSKLLNVSAKIVVSQCFDFVSSGDVVKEFEYAQHLFNIGKHQKLSEKLGVTDILNTEKNKNKYGRMQTTLVIVGENAEDLERLVKRFAKDLGDSGYVFIMEDIILEDVLYSILPGNFRFVKRREYTTISYLAEFVTSHLSIIPKSDIKDSYNVVIRASDDSMHNISLCRNGMPNNILIFSEITGSSNLMTNYLTLNATNSTRIVAIDNLSSSRIISSLLREKYYNTEQDSFRVSFVSILKENIDNGILFFKCFLIALAVDLGVYDNAIKDDIANVLVHIRQQRITEISQVASMVQNALLKKAVMGFSRTQNQKYDCTIEQESEIFQFGKKYCGFNVESSLKDDILSMYIALKSASLNGTSILKVDNLFANRIMKIDGIGIQVLMTLAKNNVLILSQGSIPISGNLKNMKEMLKLFKTIIHSGNNQKNGRSRYFTTATINVGIFSVLNEKQPVFVVQDGSDVYKVDIMDLTNDVSVLALMLHESHVSTIEAIEKLDIPNMKNISDIISKLISRQ